MDDQTFDRLTRRLAAGTSRRRVLAGLAGAALGGRGLHRAAAQGSDEPVSCGGFAGFPCPAGFTCVDNPTDECDPATGGADCLGICRPSCGTAVCGSGEYCCNESCSICAPIGESCTEQFCGPPCAAAGEACGPGCCEGLTCSTPDPSAGLCLANPPVPCQSDADCLDDDGDPCTGATCQDGICVPFVVTCAPGFICCGNGECVDVPSDPAHCGACGSVCASRVCADGSCAPVDTGCDEGEVSCDGTCVATCCDNHNCGGCGIVCGDGETCFEGVCDCPSGQCEEPGETPGDTPGETPDDTAGNATGSTTGSTTGGITVLPTTGSGSAATERRGGLGATALAAVVALGTAAVRRAVPRWRDG